MKIKNETVNMDLTKEMNEALSIVEFACKEIEGISYEFTVTCASNGVHMKNSKHYTKEAIDIRSFDMQRPRLVRACLQKNLGKNFDVILERTHIHIEFDPK